MNTKARAQDPRSKIDVVLWVLIIVLVCVALAADYYFSGIAWSLRLAGWIILVCLLVFLVLRTSKGQQMWKFAKEARIEMRKVVWPTRQDTVRATAIIALLVLVTALILWGVDSILLWLVGLLTS
jgi:preprotein translocase subunit SecE